MANWTGFDVGPHGVKGVPKTPACLFNWGKGSGAVIVEETFAFGEEDLLEEELQRLYGHPRRGIDQEFLCNGFSIISPR